MLALRHDLDGGQSNVSGVELLGMRVNDLYEQPEFLAALTKPFDEVCAQEGWVPPWAEDPNAKSREGHTTTTARTPRT